MDIKKYGFVSEQDKKRDIPIQVLENKLGDHLLSLIILKIHLLTECDVSSKIGVNSSTMKNNPEKFLEDYRIGNLTLEQSLLHHNNSIHSPLNFGYKSVNGILLQNKYLRVMATQM